MWIAGGCTSVDVRPVEPHEPITAVLIEENAKVWRSDFVTVLSDGFARHGIDSRLIRQGDPVGDAYVVRYTARQKWDMAMYMSDATIWIYKNDKEIARAVYHLKGGGGFSLMKWQGTQAKIDPVIDELLAGVGAKASPASSAARELHASTSAQGALSSAGASSIDEICEMPSAIDRAECRGELAAGMTTNEILKLLGRPDEMSADGTEMRYGDRYLTLDEKSRLIAVSSGPTATQ